MSSPDKRDLKAYRKDFRPGSLGEQRATKAATIETLAEEGVRQYSIYYWCWRFMCLSPVFLFAESRKVSPSIDRAAQIWSHSGGRLHLNYELWWRVSGIELFAESMPWPRVRVRTDLNIPALKDKVLVLEIPLTVHTRTIYDQLSDALAKANHLGRRLDPAKHSTAPFKLHTMHYRIPALAHRYWVLLYRLLYPKVPDWRIGDRLQVAPHHRVRGVERAAVAGDGDPFANLQAITGRHLYHARALLDNMGRGVFPDSAPSATPIDYESFFGAQLRDEFQKFAVPDKETGQCEWLEMLEQRGLRAELLDHILDVNNGQFKGPREYVRPGRGQGLEQFVLGQTDSPIPIVDLSKDPSRGRRKVRGAKQQDFQ